MKKKGYFKLTLCCIIASLLIPVACAPNKTITQDVKLTPLCSFDILIYAPIIGGAEGNNPSADDALRACPGAIRALRYGEPEDWGGALAIIERFMEEFYSQGYLSRPEHGNLKEGWVTSMDAPLLAVAAQLAYERTGEECYANYVDDLIIYFMKPIDEKGFMLELSESEWWPLEYASADFNDENAWFVLNGSLFGTVCMEMLFHATGDIRLQALSEKVLAAYKLKMEQFYYPDGTWCYYALNSETGKIPVNRQDKLFIEIHALRALQQLTGEAFYGEHLDRRIDMLRGIYPLYAVHNENQGTLDLTYLRASAPHPYEIDCYPNILEFIDKEGRVIATAEAKTRFAEDNFIRTTVPDTAIAYRVYAKTNVIEDTFLFEDSIKIIAQEEASVPNPVNGSWSAGNDALLEFPKQIKVDSAYSDKLYGNTYFRLETPILCDPEVYWGVEIINSSDITLPTGIVLYDTAGKTIVRTGNPCVPGKNLILFSHLGFAQNEKPVDEIQTIGLTYYTSVAEGFAPILITIGDVYVFHNTCQLVSYWADTPYIVNYTYKPEMKVKNLRIPEQITPSVR